MLIKKKFQLLGVALLGVTVAGMAFVQLALRSIDRLQESRQSISGLETQMLLLRRHEKDFLARKELSYVEKYTKVHQHMVAELDTLAGGLGNEPRVATLRGLMTAYRDTFALVVDQNKVIGLNPEDGLYGKLRTTVHNAESRIEAQNSDAMMRHMLMLRRHEKDFMLRRDEKYVEKFEKGYGDFTQALKTRSWPAAVRAEVGDLMSAYHQSFLDLVAAERKVGLKPSEGLMGGMRETIHQTEAVFKELGADAGKSIDTRMRTAEALQFTITAALLAGVFTILVIVGRRVQRALENMSQGISRASDNKDLSLRLEVHGNDEFAHTAAAFNRMNTEFDASMRRLSNSSLGLSTTASELAAITERTNLGVNRQHQESDQVATAMNQMAATVQEVARHASAAAKASQDASEHAMHGKDVVTHASNGLRALTDEVKNTADAISQLEKESENIGTVLSVIQGIAEQTNLLALNAAIEAARAGESGRGFAVVADEVRTLAQRSKESTEEIKTIIERLQAVARTAVQAMDAGLKQSTVAVEQAEAAGATLEQIADAVLKINDMNSQIATAAEEQSAVAETINQSVTTIAGISDETATMAKQTQDTGTRLATLAMELHQAIGIFKLSGQALDLSKAKAAHLAWKAKLRSFLDGKQALTLQEAVSHKHCVLGKWYYGEGLEKFGKIQAMLDIEAPHAEMHSLIKGIIEQQQASNRDQAEECFKKIGPLSERIVALLDEVEHAVNAGEAKKSA